VSEKDYAWLIAVAVISRRQELEDADQDDPRRVSDITGIAGTLDNATAVSANDLAARQLVLLFILAWNLARYRAICTAFAQNSVKKLQNVCHTFRALDFAQSLAITGFPEKSAKFWAPPSPCQMNSPLTPNNTGRPGWEWPVFLPAICENFPLVIAR